MPRSRGGGGGWAAQEAQAEASAASDDQTASAKELVELVPSQVPNKQKPVSLQEALEPKPQLPKEPSPPKASPTIVELPVLPVIPVIERPIRQVTEPAEAEEAPAIQMAEAESVEVVEAAPLEMIQATTLTPPELTKPLEPMEFVPELAETAEADDSWIEALIMARQLTQLTDDEELTTLPETQPVKLTEVLLTEEPLPLVEAMPEAVQSSLIDYVEYVGTAEPEQLEQLELLLVEMTETAAKFQELTVTDQLDSEPAGEISEINELKELLRQQFEELIDKLELELDETEIEKFIAAISSKNYLVVSAKPEEDYEADQYEQLSRPKLRVSRTIKRLGKALELEIARLMVRQSTTSTEPA